MIDVIDLVDEREEWSAYTSRWSLLEVARALKKDGKPRELIKLNLKELRRHKILLTDVTRIILSNAERIVTLHNLYASDALHVATFESITRKRRLDAILTDDQHVRRLRDMINVLTLSEISI